MRAGNVIPAWRVLEPRATGPRIDRDHSTAWNARQRDRRVEGGNERDVGERGAFDEMVGQLLATEGFTSVEEVAYVELDEIAMIEGFDDETAVEIQARARDYLAELEAKLDEERIELGVSDDLRSIDGLTTAMLVALGKDDIKTMEDLAGCAADDLIGWTERKDGETKRFDGALSGFDMSRAEAENIVMAARLAAGWITEEELAAQSEEFVEEDEEAEEIEAAQEEPHGGAILNG